jgi:hypothetical protein
MKFADHMDDIFDDLKDLTEIQRHSIKERYRFLMDEYRYRCRLYAVLFYMFRITMTVGSLAVPALLSIQNGNTAPAYLYWVTWAISLAVTTSNGVMTLFKLDKRFFSLHATAERLRSETWQFIQLAGRYSGHHGTHRPSHANQFVYYCSQLEKINMARVDEEYVKAGDDSTKPPSAAKPADPSAKPSGDLMVPSPADQSNLNTPVRDSITLVEDDDGQPQSSQASKISQKNTKTLPLNIKQDTPTSKKSLGPGALSTPPVTATLSKKSTGDEQTKKSVTAVTSTSEGDEQGTSEGDTADQVQVPGPSEPAVSTTSSTRITILPESS